ncbi:ubiquinone anaerobic biosynthesis protein UbiV [Pelagibacterium limicola]|uniref:ubiquinone anaerobic biosynthesis protein UbiV n=1 Tax=Pelagibacterium limicola TaxID=2791022 RepID=UPI0018AFCCE5|nr:U32 family peptidase [Pelagibacterium limicola]
MNTRAMNITLGPVPYLWAVDEWRDFYFRIADEAPADTVTVGEFVCSKRLHFFDSMLDQVISRLERGGKKVHLAGLGLLTLEREHRAQRRLIGGHDQIVEVSDLSTLMQVKGRPHAIGPLVNIYNVATTHLFAANGAISICLPPELPMRSVEIIAADFPDLTIEVLAFGRTPLAISARCAHARAKGNTKDNCQFVCGEEPDGLVVQTLDRQPFLVLNGVQTMSYTCHVVLAELPTLAAAGVRSIRLSPQRCDMVAVARTYRALLDGALEAGAAREELATIYPGVPFSNGFIHGIAGAEWVDAA